MTTPTSPFVRFFRFLGRVRFTTILLLGGAIIMTIGTILESRGSREIAWSAIYGTAWFDAFLFLIGVNLIIAVVNRLPIRRHQWPFVVTHFAIVILLAGAWMSRTYGYEGRLMVYEGERENRLYLDEPEIQVRWLGGPGALASGRALDAGFALPQGRRLDGRVLRSEGGGMPGIRIAEHLPDGVFGAELEEGPEGAPPGVEVLISMGQQRVEHWLIADDSRFARKDVGPLEIELRRQTAGDLAEAGSPAERVGGIEKPQLEILLAPDGGLSLKLTTASGPSPRMPLEVGRSVPLSAIGLDLRVQRVLARARPEFGVKPSPAGSPSGDDFVRLEASMNGSRQSFWLKQGDGRPTTVQLGRGQLEARYGVRMLTLPFSIALEEFELINYPGSNRPAEYRSRVQVEQAAANLPTRDEVISMNRPLDVAGFRLFQSSYKLANEGRPEATILSVSYDPGVPIVYVSFGLLILGIAWGLRVPRPKLERPAGVSELRRASPAGGQPDAAPTTRKVTSPSVRRSVGRAVGLLLAVLAGLATATDGRAQASAANSPLPVEETRGFAILSDGRVKPLLTYANETALAVTGRESFDGLSSLELLWGYVLDPDEFKNRPYVRVDSLELKALLGREASEKRFSFNSLIGQQAFGELVGQALQRQQADIELSRLERDALEAYTKLDRIEGLVSGRLLSIVPGADQHSQWTSPAQPQGHGARPNPAVSQGFARLAAAYRAGDPQGFTGAARALATALRSANPAVYPTQSALDRELFYEDLNTFGNAWKLYLVGFLVILLAGFSQRPWGYALGCGLLVGGFAFHSIGLGMRWVIADRAPVSDMYESLVFMGWGAIALGLVTEAFNRKRFLALAAGLMGFVCLIFAENLPIDSAINPLVPVLAHTYWLSVHVMTVMLSYSAFALAMVLGHVMIAVEVFQRQNLALLNSLSKLLYKTLQLGVLFLAGGIIFGAIWANESWGRYWGWDPKETWSLITFFVYLAIIHARFAGWLRHFGIAASAILGFLAVVMTYYGVNFILAAGMHAYGFSEGGQFYAVLYAVVEIAFVLGARVWLQLGQADLPGRAAQTDPT